MAIILYHLVVKAACTKCNVKIRVKIVKVSKGTFVSPEIIFSYLSSDFDAINMT